MGRGRLSFPQKRRKMKIEVFEKKQVNILTIEGSILSGDEHQLAEEIENSSPEKVVPKFVIDLKKVPFINSTALGVLLSIYKYVDKKNGRVVLAGPNEEIIKVLGITKLSAFFEIFRNTDEAIESFDF